MRQFCPHESALIARHVRQFGVTKCPPPGQWRAVLYSIEIEEMRAKARRRGATATRAKSPRVTAAMHREEILRLDRAGRTPVEIAKAVGLSRHTIALHLARWRGSAHGVRRIDEPLPCDAATCEQVALIEGRARQVWRLLHNP